MKLESNGHKAGAVTNDTPLYIAVRLGQPLVLASAQIVGYKDNPAGFATVIDKL